MRGFPLAMTTAILLLTPPLASGPLVAQAQSDSVPLAAGMKVRLHGTSLGPGWHQGHLVQMTVTGVGDCLAFEPAGPSQIAGMMLDASDSVEVWVQRTSSDSTVARGDTTQAHGEWVGVSRTRLHALSHGCRMPGR